MLYKKRRRPIFFVIIRARRLFSRTFDILTRMNMCAKIVSVIAACAAPFMCAAHTAPSEHSDIPCALLYTVDTTEEKPIAEVKINVGGKTVVYTDRPLIPSDFTVTEQIAARRINSPLSEKMRLVDEYLQNGADYKTALRVCFPLLDATVKDIADKMYVAPVDSTAAYSGGKFTATKERYGEKLDEDRLYGGIYYSLKFGSDYTVKATTIPLAPSVTQKELAARLTLRSEYTTDFTSSTESRSHNVALALSKFDGAKIAVGQTLSFNTAVGARTEENGFESAKVIINGEYVDGVGGGVCQASTAVYNAALIAGLDCAANAHSICPSYCPPGLDAMISSFSDLLITNNTGSDAYISVAVNGGRATVRIFGKKDSYTRVPESEIVKTIEYERREVVDTEHKFFDASAASGDRLVATTGKDGYESITYIKYYKDGKFVKRVKIRDNVYKSAPQITVIAP